MESVNSCWSTRPSPWCTSRASPTRITGTSAAMTSSRRTMMKSTWVTVWATGWRCMSRASVRKVSEPVSSERSWLAPASPLRATRSSRADHGDGERIGAVPVDDAGDLPLAAQAAHGPRADGAPNLGCKNDFGHNGISSGGENGVRGRPTASGERPTSVVAPRAGLQRARGPPHAVPPPEAPGPGRGAPGASALRPGCRPRRARRPRCPRTRRRWRRR